MDMLAIAICRKKPTVAPIGEDCYLIAYQADSAFTSLVAEETWKNCEKTKEQSSQFTEKCYELEWKLPEDETSHLITYLGTPIRFVKSRFRMMKTLILAKGERVSYEVLSKAGWGAVIDKDVLEDGIRNLNNFLAKHGITKFVHCDHGFVYMDSHLPAKRHAGSEKRKTEVNH